MSRYFLFASLLWFSASASAQITIDLLPVPEDGDTILLVTDVDPGPFNLGSGGLDQSWTFQLDGAVPVNTFVSDNMQDTIFAAANRIFTTGPVNVFYQVTQQDWTVLGLTSLDPLGLGLTVESKYTTPLIEMRAPLSFSDAHFQSTRLNTNIPLDFVPDSVLNMLPLVPDSLRLAIATFRNEVVDASGMLEVNGQSWEVLRQKRTDMIELVFEAKISILPWTDVTPLILPFLPEGIELVDTMSSYRFMAEGENAPVAEVFMESDSSIQRVDYMGEPLVAGVRDEVRSLIPVTVFPNPAHATFTLDFAQEIRMPRSVRAYDFTGRTLPAQWTHVSAAGLRVNMLSEYVGPAIVEVIDNDGLIVGRATVLLE